LELGSFEHAYRMHRERLVRLATLLGGRREEAEEIVHDVFLACQGRWAAVDEPASYLTRAVVFRCRDAQRRQYRRRSVRVDPPPVTMIPEFDETWASIRGLPPLQRQVVVLRYYEDMSLDEIASLLDRSPATVRSDHRRALQRSKRSIS
jgi:RNA polymerase sigma factor (sigma-70 family)